MTSIHGLYLLVITAAIAFGITNGFLDGGSLISTVVTTRALQAVPAVILVSIFEMAGLLALGHAVAITIGNQLIQLPPNAVPVEALLTVLSGVSGALLWNFIMWRIGLPSSSSHAIMGALAGAGWAAYGMAAVAWIVFAKIILFLALVPVMAFLASVILVKLVYWLGQFVSPAVARPMRVLQVGVLGLLAMAHGSNNGQKCAGVMLLALGAQHLRDADAFAVRFLWLAGGALIIGILLGSRRTLETTGRRFFRLEREQGFCAELATTVLIGISSLYGYPVSTGHTMSASIVGAGVANTPRSVRWSLVGEIGFAWLLTIPTAGAAGAILATLAKGLRHVVS